MDDKLEKRLKKQEKDIDTLKKMVTVLKQQNNKLTAGYKRNADKIRLLQGQVSGLNSKLRRIQ